MLNLQSAVSLLMNRAGAHLTRDELESLSSASELAEAQARYLRELAEAIGCSVNQDGAADGIFQSRDELKSLMWHFAAAADQVASLIEISQRANCMLAAMPYRRTAAQP